MTLRSAVWGLVLVLVVGLSAAAQTPPRLVRFGGIVRDAQGLPQTGTATLTFAIYAEAEGGAALWTEVQPATLDAQGRYAVVLGATQPDGVPLDLFTTGAARWLGVQVAGQAEGPRVMLLSVPYALKAGDLLVTSATPGYAMVSRPVNVKGVDLHRPGTILGKALEPLASGKGEILVLLTLQ